MTINEVGTVDDQVMVRHALLSVSDKRGLDILVPELLRINPEIKLFSTGGTYSRLREILGAKAGHCLTPVSKYTGQPETQGGLVKTLDFKIYLGILTETYNDFHRADLERTGALPLDMIVVNLYPFQKTVAQPDVTPEKARGNIDIGGPCMLRAAAKNFLRVASVVDPGDYNGLIDEMNRTGGKLALQSRFQLARKAFEHTAAYDRSIADYLANQSFGTVANCYSHPHTAH